MKKFLIISIIIIFILLVVNISFDCKFPGQTCEESPITKICNGTENNLGPEWIYRKTIDDCDFYYIPIECNYFPYCIFS